MSERAPYSRVYWSIRNDERLASIYPDDRLVGAWLKLLLAADAMWPAPADIPASARRASVVALEAAGVIELLPGGLYRFHGLDAERGRRRDAAASSARMRTHSERSPNGQRTVSERNPVGVLAEPSLAKPSRAESARDPAEDYFNVTGKWPTDKTLAWIDDLAGRFGADATSRAIGNQHKIDPDGRTLLGRVKDELSRHARQLDRAEQVDEQARLAEKRKSGVNVPLIVAAHNFGKHEAAPVAECPYCRRADA